MVTSSRDRLLTAMLMVYSKLNANSAALSALVNLAGTYTPRRKRVKPPIDPQRACSAVRA